MSISENTLPEYLNQTKYIILATVNDNTPVLRSLGSFAVEGTAVYFSTHKSTDKVKQIESNPTVSVFFQHENQELSSFVNVSITGEADKIAAEEDLAKAVNLIGARNPGFKERFEKGEISDNIFFRVDPREVKILDFSKGIGPGAVQVITV